MLLGFRSVLLQMNAKQPANLYETYTALPSGTCVAATPGHSNAHCHQPVLPFPVA